MNSQNKKRTSIKAAAGILLLAALILIFFRVYRMFSQKAQEGENGLQSRL